jgi:molybdopterin-guanine dinucleotide biosynthesis protein A
MGTDKAELIVGNVTLLESVVSYFRGGFAPIWVVGRACPAGWSVEDVEFLSDRQPDLGPLEGIATVLAVASRPVLVVACDLPCLTQEAVNWLVTECGSGLGDHGLAVYTGERLQPLFSVYRPEAFDWITELLDQGERALHRCIEGGRFRRVNAPGFVEKALYNVNTREDWVDWST